MRLLNPGQANRSPARRNGPKKRVLRKLPPLVFLVWLCALTFYLLRAQNPPPGSAVSGGNNPAPQTSTRPIEAGPPASKNKIRVRVEVVNVPVTVIGKRGLPVIDLTQNDFRVFEDGRPQAIRYFSQESHQPLRIGVMLDTSNSARRQLSFEKDAATEFVFRMLEGRNTKNQVFLETFDASSSIIQDFTSDTELLNEKILGLKAGGGKAFFDAIYSACKDKMMHAGEPESTRRILVLISDGRDVQSQHSLDEAISMAHKAETMIYVIGNAAYGFENPGDEILQALAEGTGGGAFFPLREAPGTDLATGYLSHGQIGETSQNKGLGAETGTFSAQRLIRIADAMESIGHELGAQYEIGYTPTNGALDGTYRTIRVLLARKGVTYRWKPGYFATAE
ncbi:MAG: VWA domain-containing protein [Terriglobia bacterium]|jgi:VWFA-related protein